MKENNIGIFNQAYNICLFFDILLSVNIIFTFYKYNILCTYRLE